MTWKSRYFFKTYKMNWKSGFFFQNIENELKIVLFFKISKKRTENCAFLFEIYKMSQKSRRRSLLFCHERFIEIGSMILGFERLYLPQNKQNRIFCIFIRKLVHKSVSFINYMYFFCKTQAARANKIQAKGSRWTRMN